MNRIIIGGDISSWGFGSGWLRSELDKVSGDIVVEISSYGGDVYESIDMYNLLRQYSKNKGQVTTLVGAKAMSGGAIITMAGDKRIAHANSTFMIHRAWTFTWGNAEDLKAEADILNGIDGIQAKEFAKYLPESEEEVMNMFTKDTYYIGKEQLESTNIFTEIIDEPLSDDTIETKNQAANAFASAKKVFQTQVEKNNYVPDFAKVARLVAKAQENMGGTNTAMPSDNVKLVNSTAGEAMAITENDIKILETRVAQRDQKIELLEDDKELLSSKLDKVNAALETKDSENAILTNKLSEAEGKNESVMSRLNEAIASNVDVKTALAMVNASTDEDASVLALDANKQTPITGGDIANMSRVDPWANFTKGDE